MSKTTPWIAGYRALKAELNDRYWHRILKSPIDCRLIDDHIVTEANNALARAHDLGALITPSLISD
ncbi:hypothetical protein [Slackia sp.]